VVQCLALLVSQVQAIVWGVLALLGILLYTEAIAWQPYDILSNRFQMVLAYMYFIPMGKCIA